MPALRCKLTQRKPTPHSVVPNSAEGRPHRALSTLPVLHRTQRWVRCKTLGMAVAQRWRFSTSNRALSLLPVFLVFSVFVGLLGEIPTTTKQLPLFPLPPATPPPPGRTVVWVWGVRGFLALCLMYSPSSGKKVWAVVVRAFTKLPALKACDSQALLVAKVLQGTAEHGRSLHRCFLGVDLLCLFRWLYRGF